MSAFQNKYDFPKVPVVAYTVAVLIASATILVYLPALQNEFVHWDDQLYVYENPHILSFDVELLKWAFLDFHASNWHPLTYISHALDYAVWGLDPMGHHLTGIIFHGLNTFIVVILIMYLTNLVFDKTLYWRDGNDTKKESPVTVESNKYVCNNSIIAGAITGLLFGLHPVHVESVAWVSERKDVLYSFFFLLSILYYYKYVYVSSGPHRLPLPDCNNVAIVKVFKAGFHSINYNFSLLLFILALLSKPMAVTLPAALIILDWYPFGRFKRAGRSNSRRFILAEKVPFFVLSLASAVLTVKAQESSGAVGSVRAYPIFDRILVAFKSLIAYLSKIIVPLSFNPFYPYPDNIRFLSIEILLPVIMVLVITLIAVLLCRRQKLWLAAWSFYIITLLPVLGIIKVGLQAMADRYMYIASLAPFMIISISAIFFFNKLKMIKHYNLPIKTLSLIISILLIGLLSYKTVKQIGVWKNNLVLWEYVVKGNQDKKCCAFAHNNLGSAYAEAGRYNEAVISYKQSQAVDPDYADAYHNLGNAYVKMGLLDDAINEYKKTINIKNYFADVYVNLGNVYDMKGLYGMAVDSYYRALEINPDHHKAHYNLGAAYLGKGLYNKAIREYEMALEIEPDYTKARNSLAQIYLDYVHDDDRALLLLKESIRIDSSQGAAKQIKQIIARIEKKINN